MTTRHLIAASFTGMLTVSLLIISPLAMAADVRLNAPAFELPESFEIIEESGETRYVTGADQANDPIVRILDENGNELSSFEAYGAGYKGGVVVEACDVTGDGESEIITGTRQGGGPHVRIFSQNGKVLFDGGFFAYGEGFRGGVNLSCGDVDGDGANEIITAPGVGGSSHIRVFSPNGTLENELIIGSHTETSGARVKVAQLDKDAALEIVANKILAPHTTVHILNIEDSIKETSNFSITDLETSLRVSTLDINEDGIDEITALPRNLELDRVDFFTSIGSLHSSTQLEEAITGTVDLKLANGEVLIHHIPKNTGETGDQRIIIDVSDQTLYAYENGVLVHQYLISSGTRNYPTPLGITEITAKLPVHRYVWSYGPDNPNNYDLAGVKWNLRFKKHYYIHSAYWHNNFGTPMSHGCINMSTPTAEVIYDWAEVGAIVEVRA